MKNLYSTLGNSKNIQDQAQKTLIIPAPVKNIAIDTKRVQDNIENLDDDNEAKTAKYLKKTSVNKLAKNKKKHFKNSDFKTNLEQLSNFTSPVEA